MIEPTPLRPDEQVAGGFIPVSLGGKEHVLPVLPIGKSREWRKAHSEMLTGIVDGIGSPSSLDEVAELISSHSESFMDMLIAYDHSGVLPEREWINDHATDREVYEGIQQVTNAAFPFGSNLLELAMMQAAQKVRRSLRSTKPSPPPTAGRRRRSKAA